MLGDPPLKIIRVPDVVRFIGAVQHVCKKRPTHRHTHTLSLDTPPEEGGYSG